MEIAALGCWNTVEALGVRLPVSWRWAEKVYASQNHEIDPRAARAFHALALHETLQAYAPVLWRTPPRREDAVEQVRFRGSHDDVGSQVIGPPLSRPLANVPLVRMLERRGLPSPEGWRGCFPCDVLASTWLGWGKLFVLRRALVSPRMLETKEGQQA